ncbi:MAG: helix-hairpin-helix domain-containing protein [Oscillochloris sp.]|nr:helix-hairpin-helix domain-containing protein [Oscillochloris sp.]
MLRPRRLLIVIAVLGIVYFIWRQRRVQAPEMFGLAAPTSPAPAAPAPPEIPAEAASKSTTPRRIVTRVHRGTPPVTSRPEAPIAPTSEPAANEEPAALGAAPTFVEPVASEEPEVIAVSGADTVPEATEQLSAEPPVSFAPEADGEEPPVPLASSGADSVPESGAPLLPSLGELVDLNTADLNTLIALPGIGPVLAQRIVAYRAEHGPFASIEDAIAVQGIGPNNINEFRHLVKV